MLFISILLSVWFVLWLIHAVFIHDTGKLFVAWMNDMYNDETEDNIDLLMDKSEDQGVYHLSCEHCNHIWWSIEPNVKYCPSCGKPFNKE